MEKKCDCECHKLHPIPCMYCSARHSDEPAPARELAAFDDTHDGKTEVTNVPGWQPPEGFPF